MTKKAGQPHTDTFIVKYQYNYEVTKATYHLFLLLQEKTPGFVMPIIANHPGFQFPKLPDICIYPVLNESPLGTPKIHNELANQLAFKGWIAHIYGLWDSHFRQNLKNAFRHELKGFCDDEGLILPEEDVMGDMRHIRHDLLHHAGVATNEHSGKCEVLTWFKPEQTMIFGTHHVFDFLNQADMLVANYQPKPADRTPNFYYWSFCSTIPEIDRHENAPRLVSLKTSVGDESENESLRYKMRVVFENGVFGSGPVLFHNDNLAAAENRNLFNMTTIDANGELLFHNGQIAPRDELYNRCVRLLHGIGERSPGMWTNWVKFREP